VRSPFAGCVALVCSLLAASAVVQAEPMVMASTTSTEQSGLFAHLLPAFTKATGVEVKVVALGTGQAIDMGRRGDADVLFVHDQVAEEKIVAEGFALKRLAVMYNDFVLVGPKADPAKVTSGKDIAVALKKIATRTRRSSRAATRAAPTRPNCATGRPPAPTLPPSSHPATRNAAAAWARR